MKYLVFLIIFMKSAFVFSFESTEAFFYPTEKFPGGKLENFELPSFYGIEAQIEWPFENESTSVEKPKAQKLKAILLALFLGHFGVHRIYLGTSANVPVVYSLTLGGGFGLLPLMDIIAIISSKDLSELSNNDHVIMWAK